MAKKQGLGRGLKSLIKEDCIDISAAGKNSAQVKPVVFEVEISKIRPNREQPRKKFDQEALEELARSIQEHGIVQPLVIKPEEGGYTIIAGERRFRAACLAGLKNVPVIIKDLPQKEVLEIALIENVQRENLNPIEEAMAYEKLINEFGLTQQEMAERIGKKRATIANRIRLLNLPATICEMVLEEKLSAGHAKSLLGMSDENAMIALADRIVTECLSVREVEELVRKKEKERPGKKKTVTVDMDPYIRDCEERLKCHLGTPVKIKEKDHKGKIEIVFHSGMELNRLLEIMNLEVKIETGKL